MPSIASVTPEARIILKFAESLISRDLAELVVGYSDRFSPVDSRILPQLMEDRFYHFVDCALAVRLIVSDQVTATVAARRGAIP